MLSYFSFFSGIFRLLQEFLSKHAHHQRQECHHYPASYRHVPAFLFYQNTDRKRGYRRSHICHTVHKAGHR